MDKKVAWVLAILFGGMLLCMTGFFGLAMVGQERDGISSFGGEAVGLVEVLGEIRDSKRVLKDLKRFEEDRSIKAIVVRIDSPGGAVGPSQEIYDAVVRIKAKKKVVASMGSLAASGGYYIAAAADKIYANAGTLTGSIGVIMQFPNVQGLLKWAGVEMTTVTAGKMKDAASPFRAMTEEEKTYFRTMLADVHAQFIEAVVQGRKLTLEEVQPYADGRVFSGRQAKELKLVDALGGIEAAVAEAGKLGGISGDPDVRTPPRKRSLMQEIAGDEDEAETSWGGALQRLLGGRSQPSLQYRLGEGHPDLP